SSYHSGIPAAGLAPAGIAVDRAARLQPVPRSVSSPPAPQSLMVRRRRPACAGTIPIQAAARDFGITARCSEANRRVSDQSERLRPFAFFLATLSFRSSYARHAPPGLSWLRHA